MADEKEQVQPIIVKKIKKGGGGHHGGAWKVAYADFVTAMMAFFLLLWLLSVATSEQKAALSNYFDPSHPKISSQMSGAGGILGGVSMSQQGAMTTDLQDISDPEPTPMKKQEGTDGDSSGTDSEEGARSDMEQENIRAEDVNVDAMTELERQRLEEELQEAEDRRFEEAMEEINQEIAQTPELQRLSEHLMMDITPEGLRIQIVDQDGRSMFAIGSADMYPFMNELLAKVATVIKDMPNVISIRGHTDGTQYAPGARYNNWDLSSDRAQSSRRAITEAGYPEDKIQNVVGKADRDHLIPEDPNSAQNRRISIILLRDQLTRTQPASIEELQEKIENNALNFDVPRNNDDNSAQEEQRETVPVIIRRSPSQNSDTSTDNNNEREEPRPQNSSNNDDTRNNDNRQQSSDPVILEDSFIPQEPRRRVLEFP